MKWLSLFSGIGGFDLALKNLNQEIIGACEIDGNSRQIFSRHFPNIRIYEDAATINPEQLPHFDGIVAGFPCQAFSVAGKQQGFNETRGTLFFEIARIASHKKPKFMLLENVVGLVNHDNGRTFAIILKTLSELGYDVEWQVINPKYFVPHNRPRIFIVCYLRGTKTRGIFPIREHEVDIIERRCRQIAKIDSYKFESSGRVYSTNGLARALKAVSGDKTGQYLIDGKLSFLTPIECERLQGFPDNWTKGQSKTRRWIQLGNAVTVPVVKYILERMITQ